MIDSKTKINNYDDIITSLTITFNNKSYKDGLVKYKRKWVETDNKIILTEIIDYVKKLKNNN